MVMGCYGIGVSRIMAALERIMMDTSFGRGRTQVAILPLDEQRTGSGAARLYLT